MKRVYFCIISSLLMLGPAAVVSAMGPRDRSAAREPWVSGDYFGQVSAAPDSFKEALAPYGTWRTIPVYGEVWVPRVTPWWRPYTEGRWVMTDAGWTWVAAEQWGWAPFHYGRWVDTADYGWSWVPGTRWAPAWVAWRVGDGYVGWAPLPPQAEWRADGGFGQMDIDSEIGERAWVFVDERQLCDPALTERILPAARDVTLVHRTRDVTRYEIANRRLFDRGVDVAEIERASGHPVPRYRLTGRSSYEALDQRPPVGDEIAVVGLPSGLPARAVRASQSSVLAPIRRGFSEQQLTNAFDRDRQQLEEHQVAERTRLERLQAEDAQSPTGETTKLVQQHEAEIRAMEQEHRRQSELLSKEEARERQAAGGERRASRTPQGFEKPTAGY